MMRQLLNANVRARNTEVVRRRTQAGDQRTLRSAAEYPQPQPLPEQQQSGNAGRAKAEQTGAGRMQVGGQQGLAAPQTAMHAEARGGPETPAVPELSTSDWQWVDSGLCSGEQPVVESQQGGGVEATLLQRVAGPDNARLRRTSLQPPGPAVPSQLVDGSALQHRMQQGPAAAERAQSEGRGVRPAGAELVQDHRRRRSTHSREMAGLGLSSASLDGCYWTQQRPQPK